MNEYVRALKRYSDFGGRSDRKEYWTFQLVNLVIIFVLSAARATIVLGLYFLVTFIPSIAAGFRRLHDTGRSAWSYLLALIPLVGSIVLIVFFCQEGNPEANKYGPPPRSAEVITA